MKRSESTLFSSLFSSSNAYIEKQAEAMETLLPLEIVFFRSSARVVLMLSMLSEESHPFYDVE